MHKDLTEILAQWPFEPGQISVRLIEADDGNPRIQVRLDLGLLQMYVDGRPDGQRPDGYDSLLDSFEARIDQSQHTEQEGNETYGDDEDNEPAPHNRTLTPDECRLLREESQQYYHRYIALLVLEDFEAVVRDTSRNLRLVDLLGEHAIEEDDQQSLESHRPYIMMMRARALASHALKHEENKVALNAIDEGIEALKLYFESSEQPEAFDQSGEVQMLRDMRDSLIPKLPVSQKAELRQRLEAAIASENFELAAILRDELKMLGG
ncbi:MAG: UvrB/UvrC motif-containing protein [Phycisphaerales bacterium]|nr:UvrB/UvrC motif-containing protein [Phycisphaerales bacterium]